MRGISNSRNRIRGSLGALIVLFALFIALLAGPETQAAPPGTYSSSSTATLLNIQLLALTEPPTLTISKASSEMTSTPLSAKASGTGLFCVGASNCQGLADATTQSAAAPADSDPPQKCQPSLIPVLVTGILTLTQGCGDAAARTSTGDPTAASSAGVTSLDAILDVGSLQPVGGTLEAVVNQIVTTIGTVVGGLPEQVPGQVTTALKALLSAIDGDRKVIAVLLGDANSKAVSEGTVVTGHSETAILKIAILPICDLEPQTLKEVDNCTPNTLDPFKHGLVIIEITGAFAEAKWPGAIGASASGDGAAPVAKIKIRRLVAGAPTFDEVVAALPPVPIPQTLLTGPLETDVKLGSVTKNVSANSADVTVNALEIHALKGLKQNATQERGGLLLQVGALNAKAQGQLPVQVLALPKTGGMRNFFFALAAILAVGAPTLYLVSRRIRRSA
jgi:LPXTG-motif cell wall-anchored protein